MEFQRSICRVKHASKGIPTVKGLFTPINQVLGIRPAPKLVFTRPTSELKKSIEGFRALLHEAHREPTKCKHLVTGDPHFVGIMDAAKEGTCGVIVGKGVCASQRYSASNGSRTSRIWCARNRTRPITNSDLELAGLLIC